MQAFRCSRTTTRLFAAWLLLWFMAMAARPALPLVEAVAACPQLQAPGHEGHQHHACTPDDGAALHPGHGSGALLHCPLCMHAAAPPAALPVQPPVGIAPVNEAAGPPRAYVRVRSAAPPPARGPPRFS